MCGKTNLPSAVKDASFHLRHNARVKILIIGESYLGIIRRAMRRWEEDEDFRLARDFPKTWHGNVYARPYAAGSPQGTAGEFVTCNGSARYVVVDQSMDRMSNTDSRKGIWESP